MSRAKVIELSFTVPITQIGKDKNLFSAVQVGELTVFAKAKFLKPPDPLPIDFQTGKFCEVTLTGVDFEKTNILPIFNLKEASSLLASIIKAAENQALSIYEQKYQS